MPWLVLTWLVGAADCEPWLVAQVERARLRAGVEALALSCPESGVAIVGLPGREGAPREVRLSGFGVGDRWVGAALIALVETRRSEDTRAPTAAASRAPEPIEAWAPRGPKPGPSLQLWVRPSVTLVGPPLQTSVGLEALVGWGWVRVGAAVARHQVSVGAGVARATDLGAVVTVPLALGRTERLALVFEPGVAAGLSLLEGAASGTSRGAATWAPAARAWAALGLEAGPLPLGLEVGVGVRAGLRVAPPGTADGVEVLFGTGAALGGYLTLGWSR